MLAILIATGSLSASVTPMIDTGTVLWLTEGMILGFALAAEQTGAAFGAATVRMRVAELEASGVDPFAVNETATSE